LTQATTQIPEIRKSPHPKVNVSETNESWVGFKLIYFIDNYGRQFSVGDQVLSKALKLLQQNGMNIAKPALEVSQLK